jgi:hypothetical protein
MMTVPRWSSSSDYDTDDVEELSSISNSPNKSSLGAIPLAKLILYITGLVLVVVGLAGQVDFGSQQGSTAAAQVTTVETVVKPSGNPPDVEVAEHSIQVARQWADIQQTLCPAGIPDTTFGPTLFALARAKLGIKRSEFAAIKQQNLDVPDTMPSEKLTYQFFHGRFGNATIYRSGNQTVAYIPIWKAASDAIRHWMDHRLIKKGQIESMFPENLFDSSRKGKRGQPTCVVTAIRDPITHFLSGYNEIEFRRYLVDINTVLPLYYNLPFNTEVQRQDRFVQFVRDFALEESRALIHEPFGHVFSMSRVLEVLGRQNGAFLSGYLPSLANLSANFPSFVTNTCHLEQDLPPMTEDMGHHDSSRDSEGFYQAAKQVWLEGGDAAKALCILHAMDYACWKNLPDGVPVVCQEVYSSPDFVNAIL